MATQFRADNIGSLLRPPELIDAREICKAPGNGRNRRSIYTGGEPWQSNFIGAAAVHSPGALC
jgi:hypothetical protein